MPLADPHGRRIDINDLNAALNAQTVLACYDDDGTGVINEAAMLRVFARAEAQTDSYVVRAYTIPVTPPIAELIRCADIEFAVAYTLQRHPEYVRTFGEESRVARLKEAQAMCERIAAGLQLIADGTGVAVANNMFAFVVDDGPRMMVTGPDGRHNGGDFG